MQCNSGWQATCFDIHCSSTSQMFAQSNQFQTQTVIGRWIWISSLWDIMRALKNVPFEVALNGFIWSIGWFPKRQSHHQLEWFHAINSCQLWNKAEVKSFHASSNSARSEWLSRCLRAGITYLGCNHRKWVGAYYRSRRLQGSDNCDHPWPHL